MDIIQNNNLRRSVLRMEEKRNILKNFVDKMEKLFGKSLKKLILYGSYARGDYKENSEAEIGALIFVFLKTIFVVSPEASVILT